MAIVKVGERTLMVDEDRIYLTRARYNAYLEEIEYMESEGRETVAQLLSAHTVTGTSRHHSLLVEQLAGEFSGYLQRIKTLVYDPVIIDDVRDAEPDEGEVSIGCTVVVQYEDDDELEEYTILGRYEVDLKLQKISCWSPIGAALLGKRVGDKVVVELGDPPREIQMEIKEVKRLPLDFEYAPHAWKERLARGMEWGEE